MGGKMVTLTAIVGGRPNLMKMAPIIRALDLHNRLGREPYFKVRLVHTGSANDPRLHDTSFGDLQMPQPDIHLGVANASSSEQTSKIMLAFERSLQQEPADGVLVVGDSDATLACALVAAKARMAVFHVEAGLRGRDAQLPAEVNRRVTDMLSALLFTPSPDVHENLRREGIDSPGVVCVGNVMIDNLFYHLERSRTSDVMERLGLIGEMVGVGSSGRGSLPRAPVPVPVPAFGVITLTQAENIEDDRALRGILQTLCGVARMGPLIFPAGAATRKKIEQLELDDYVADLSARLESFGGVSPGLPAGIYTVPPMAYLDFLRVLSQSTVVFTDSGGIQEETTAMGIPCITMRDETERPITVTQGTNVLVGQDRERLRREAVAAFSGHGKRGRIPELWDGRASERVVAHLARYFAKRPGGL